MLLTVFQSSVSEKSVDVQHFEQDDDEATVGGQASSSGNEASIVMASLFTYNIMQFIEPPCTQMVGFK